MNAAQLIPDCTRIRRCDAEDIADWIVAHIAKTKSLLTIWIGADGAVGYEWHSDPNATSRFASCMSLVGRYDHEATAAQIRDDILAMECEPIGGKVDA